MALFRSMESGLQRSVCTKFAELSLGLIYFRDKGPCGCELKSRCSCFRAKVWCKLSPLISLLSEFLLSLYVARIAWNGSSATRRAVCSVIMTIGWIGMVLHILGMDLILVFQGSQLTQLIKSPVQQFVWNMAGVIRVQFLGWAPILLHRFMLPSEDAVSLTFQLSASTNDDGGFKPAASLNRSLFLFACILAMGSVFDTSLHTDESALFPLAAVMRSKPFAYFAAPVWLASIIMFCFGVGFTVVQQRLSAGVWQVLPSVLAVILMLSACGSMLLIPENERFTWIFALTFLLSFLP
ncbi:unnamed protein product [Polarella glacialis]|uniref:Uncharacterized protein n=1 Tax=Polarella glacialis TaxID=89957 RepID=A0A813HHR6_POLGL|nr:unnamed protein product [Polarella glacialis]